MPTEIVEKVNESRWMKDGEMVTTYYVTLVDGTGEREVPCYSPMGKDLKEDAPLPDGWEVKTSQKGKLYLATPKPARSGGERSFTPRPAAWANTEEGEKYVQERMDRRTALMQAIASTPTAPLQDIARYADNFYAWLRAPLETVSAPRVVASGQSEAVRAPAMVPGGEAVKTGRVGADTPSDGGGVQDPPSSPTVGVPGSAPDRKPSGSAHEGPGTSTTHAEKWSPYGNPEKCAHQLVPGIKGWLKCTKCGRADKEAAWA